MQIDNVKFSIVIPVYNMGTSLEKCILSILKQDYENYEIILVDDGSKDDSYAIGKRYADNYSNIICVHQDNQGSGPARNTGIVQASGDYFLFIDSDDLLVEGALRVLANRAKESNADLYVFGYEVIAKTGRHTTKNYTKKKLSGTTVRNDYCPYFANTFTWGIQGAPWNKLFRANVVKTNKVEYPALRRHQDEVFISRFVDKADSIQFIEDVLYIHCANDAKLIWKKYPDTYLDIVEELYNFRKNIIIPWNTNNDEIKALIYSEYINNIFRACFKLFDSEKGYNYKKRKLWYRDYLIKRFDVQKVSYKNSKLGKSKILQNIIFCLAVKYRKTWLVDILVKCRVAYVNR